MQISQPRACQSAGGSLAGKDSRPASSTSSSSRSCSLCSRILLTPLLGEHPEQDLVDEASRHPSRLTQQAFAQKAHPLGCMDHWAVVAQGFDPEAVKT